MMVRERNPTIQIPPWPTYDDQPIKIPYLLQFLPSDEDDSSDPPVDAYSCDEFRMYEFKIRRCARGRSHDWTECPYAHPGEKARRRDPRKYHYSGTACPEFRKGSCKRGEGCEFAHGVFECWLHPARYRTQVCKDGVGCRRRVCFFAHTPEQLRVVSPARAEMIEGYDGSPMRRRSILSPTSTLVSPTVLSESPPVSPSMQEVVMGMMKMDLCKNTSATARSLGFGRFPCESVPEKIVTESNVDEPEWFSDLVN